MNTFVVGIWLNLAVAGGTPRIVMLTPIEPSVEPMASISTACSMRSSRASFTSAVHITPDEMIVVSDEVSYGVPRSAASSNARMMGLAKASPTITIPVARWRCIVSSNSCGSSDRFSRVMTVPPARWGMNVPSHTPVPCISGQAGMEIRWPADAMSPAISAASVGGARPSIG